MAFGRGDEIDGMMAMSTSDDRGRTWDYRPTVFPPIRGGQRLVLKRLAEGPLMFVSFADEPMAVSDASDAERTVQGMYCAVSFDDGATWTNRKVVSDGGGERVVEMMDGAAGPMSRSRSEPMGYLTACQATDGLVHLISSRNHYTFNLAWLTEPPRAS